MNEFAFCQAELQHVVVHHSFFSALNSAYLPVEAEVRLVFFAIILNFASTMSLTFQIMTALLVSGWRVKVCVGR